MRRVGLIGGICFALLVSDRISQSAVLYPFFDPVRTEITDEIATMTSGTNALTPADLRSLTQARRAINRGGTVSLINDLQVLTIVSTALSRPHLNGSFQPLLMAAVNDYADVLDNLSASIAARLSTLPPSQDTAYVQVGLEEANNFIERARSDSLATTSARLLSRASIRLVSLQATVNRMARTAASPPVTAPLSALVNGQPFSVQVLSGAAYNPALGAISISGSQVAGFQSQSLTISLLNVPPGTSTHQLGSVSSGNYAIFRRSGTNTVGYISVSGTAIVTLDLISQTVKGTFSFVGAADTGFTTSVQVSGGIFSTSLR